MVRRAELRQRRYEAGINPDVIGARFGQVKEGMVRQESTYFPQIALVEGEVKRLVEAVGIPSYQVAQYVNVGRQCYSIAKRFTQATRDQEAQRVVDHWASRGLDGPLLVLACRAGGCEVAAPAAVCYNPCVHGSDKHDATVFDTVAKLAALGFVRMKTGTYTGDGTTSKAITGVGFKPRFLWIFTHLVAEATSEDFKTFEKMGVGLALYKDGSVQYDNRILSLDADGFTVSDDGADNFPNKTGQVCDYLALG